ncbi:hypothetical protein P7C70_g6141, partial [Phenoliferia sp. Uapishka_3]
MPSSEREPLLSHTSQDDSPQPTLTISHLASTLAALRANKLPTTQQLTAILRSFLRSPLLQIDGTIFTTQYGSGRVGTGALTREGERVREALRDVVSALLRIAEEKDPENAVQEFLYSCRHAQVSLKLPATSLPPASPDGIEHAQASLHTILTLFITSPQLRSLLRDSAYLARDIFEAAVEDTGEVGEAATAVVDRVVEHIAPEGESEISGEGKDKEKEKNYSETEKSTPETPDVRPPPTSRAAKSAEDLRDEFVDRFKEILVMIQANPAYQSAIRSLLLLVKTYLREIIESASISASVKTPKSVKAPTSLLVPVLEPFTGGPGSLSSLREKLDTLAQYTTEENRISSLLSDLDSYVSKALLEVGYLSSATAHRRAAKLRDEFLELSKDNPSFRADIAEFVQEIQKVLGVITSDKSLSNLLGALEGFGSACEGWAATATKVAVGQQGIWGDLVEWVVPRILGVLRELPLPRIEFKSEELEMAIDAPPFLSTSFIPDSIRFDTETSLKISPFAPDRPNSFTSSSTFTLEGLRMSTDNIGYWIKYRSFCLPLVESGLLDLHFGTSESGGVGASIDFSTSTMPPLTEAEDKERKTLFDVQTSAITIVDFDVRPHASSHPILMWFIRPILRRVVRKQVEAMLEEQIKGLLELGSRVGWEIQERSKGSGWRGLFGAVLDVTVNGYATEEEEREKAKDAVQQVVEEEEAEQSTTIHVSGKGVIIDLEAGQVGIGEEGIVIPEGEAETPLPRPTLTEIVQEQSKEAVREGEEAADALLNGVAAIGEAVEGFDEEVEEEKESKGWRSDAFDWSE